MAISTSPRFAPPENLIKRPPKKVVIMPRDLMYPPAKRERETAINPYVRFVLRPISFPVATYLHARSVTANQCTVASGVVLLLSLLVAVVAPFAGAHAQVVFVAGIFGVNFYWFLDVIDGNLARLSRQASPWGQFMENSFYLTAGFSIALVTGWFAYVHAPIADGWQAITGLPPSTLMVLGVVIALARLYRRVLLEMGERIAENEARAVSTPNSLPRYSVPMRILYAISGAPIPLLLVAAIVEVLPLWLVFYAFLTVLTIAWAPISVYRQMKRLTKTA